MSKSYLVAVAFGLTASLTGCVNTIGVGDFEKGGDDADVGDSSVDAGDVADTGVDLGVDTTTVDSRVDDGADTSDTAPVETGLTDSALADGAVDTATPPDTLVTDTFVDSTLPDTIPVDTGTLDIGPTDTGPLDTGPADTGPVDTGPADTGPIDTGVVDSGPPDTGPLCGNGKLESGEDCDRAALNGKESCAYGLTSCQVCSATCKLVPGAVSYCGDGSKVVGEQCDYGSKNGTLICAYGLTSCAVCDASCRALEGGTNYCGDGLKSTANGEQCDSGVKNGSETCAYNVRSCNVCDATCKSVPGATSFCGDGRIDAANGETCDHGNNNTGDGCSPTCKVESGFTCAGTPSVCSSVCMALSAPAGAFARSKMASALSVTGDACYEAWVNLTDPSPTDANYVLSSVSAGNMSHFALNCFGAAAAGGPRLSFYVENGASGTVIAEKAMTCADKRWHHVAACRSVTGATVALTLFWDGVNVATASGPASIAPPAALVVGGYDYIADGSQPGLRGIIDEIRISSTLRYTTTFTPTRRLTSDAATLALWHLDEGLGSVSANASSSGANLSLSPTTAWTPACIP